MAKMTREELTKHLVSSERSGLPVRKRQPSKHEILQGIDSANREAKKASDEIRARLRREAAA
ncbi:hypothetical protein [Arhodomonas sp. SL1]|uniref:hypothetical protein n=1 Tax=Arhodomonas sp. SL1 TaxID=3425691 RepID=UPI003F88065B